MRCCANLAMLALTISWCSNRLADPVLARQLLPATPDRGTTYQMMPVSRTPSSFTSHDPRYARFRTGQLARQPAKEVTVAQVGGKCVLCVNNRSTRALPPRSTGALPTPSEARGMGSFVPGLVPGGKTPRPRSPSPKIHWSQNVSWGGTTEAMGGC